MRLGKFKGIIVLVIVFSFIFMVCLRGETIAQEKWHPEKQIDLVIGMAPGGPIDVSTRIIIEELKNELKVPLVIVYKPGAFGLAGILSVINAKPDGYTIMPTISASLTVLPAMEKNPSFDPGKDLTPIACVAMVPNVLTTNSSSKLTSFDAMITFAKKNPGKLNCVSMGIGSLGHFALEYLKTQGVDITHIPTKGASPALAEILGNHVDLALTAYSPVAPHIKGGQLRLLVTTSKLNQEPGVPTWAQVGFPPISTIETWLGFLGPSNLPKRIVERLSLAFEKSMQSPSVVQSIEKMGFNPVYIGPEELKKQILEEYKIMKGIAQSAGLVK